ncbi:YihY/virulence factor BrkB family protein [Oceanobacillus sp. J11TS1]|uniref:YihY/virulence factor BrkB family protein n=1 Tax=Oceanobacillus sp. J11TS1 TaxID=2807191 RepID=UPI001B0873D7|nr:YihY/virulence factor BrkB family protein [Oceanobacillus sp. J11TS1]GIO24910.1 transporter [Oceanobacillus sp. J11TS1]
MQVWARFDEVDVFGLAAQLSYFFILSLFPFLIFLLNLIPYLPINMDLILATLGDFAPEQVIRLITTNLESLTIQNGGLLSLSIIGTLWAASNGVNAITRAFNYAYRINTDRSFIVARLVAMILTIGMILIIILALLLPLFGRMIGTYLFSWVGFADSFLAIWGTLRWVVSSFIFFIVLLFLYKLAPNRRLRFTEVIWGTAFATFAWQLVSWGFSFYVNNLANYSTTYGSLGTIIILLIWFYLFGIIVITGGILNATLLDRKSA